MYILVWLSPKQSLRQGLEQRELTWESNNSERAGSVRQEGKEEKPKDSLVRSML